MLPFFVLPFILDICRSSQSRIAIRDIAVDLVYNKRGNPLKN